MGNTEAWRKVTKINRLVMIEQYQMWPPERFLTTEFNDLPPGLQDFIEAHPWFVKIKNQEE